MSVGIEDVPKSPVGAAREKFRFLEKYIATRKAILACEPLYDYDAERLERDGFLKPWDFQKADAAIASVPALIAALLLDICGVNDAATPFWKWWDRIATTLIVAFVPWLSYVGATWLGRSSLLKRDRTPERVARARRAYVYLSNSYLAWPELIFALTIATNDVLLRIVPTFGPISPPGVIGMWYLVLLLKMIPSDLFALNGYREHSASSLALNPIAEKVTVTTEELSALRRKWRFIAVVGVPSLGIAVNLGLAVIAAVVALILTSIAG